jgi:hypothetical protein
VSEARFDLLVSWSKREQAGIRRVGDTLFETLEKEGFTGSFPTPGSSLDGILTLFVGLSFSGLHVVHGAGREVGLSFHDFATLHNRRCFLSAVGGVFEPMTS